jgi:hypothetical protein
MPSAELQRSVEDDDMEDEDDMDDDQLVPEQDNKCSSQKPVDGAVAGGSGGSTGGVNATGPNVARKNAEADFPQDPRVRVANTIVLQPGSHSLRIGRATDESPTLVPHLLARLVKGDVRSAARPREDSAAAEKERERELAEVTRSLQRFTGATRNKTQPSATPSAPNPPTPAATAVDIVEEEVMDATSKDTFEFIGMSGGERPPFVCGEEALRVSCAPMENGERYVLRQPMLYGRLQHHGCIEETYQDLEALWTHALVQVCLCVCVCVCVCVL